MQILIKTLTGTKFTVETEDWNTVLDIKENIQELLRIPSNRQRLVYEGKELMDDGVFLDQINLVQTSREKLIHSSSSIVTLILVLRLTGGGNGIAPKSIWIQHSRPSESDDDDDDDSFDSHSDHRLQQNGFHESINVINGGTHRTGQEQIIAEMGSYGSIALGNHYHIEEAQVLAPRPLEVNTANQIHEDDAEHIPRFGHDFAPNLCSEKEHGFDRRAMDVIVIMIAAAAFLVPKAMTAAFEELKEGRNILGSWVILLMVILVLLLLLIQYFKVTSPIRSSTKSIQSVV